MIEATVLIGFAWLAAITIGGIGYGRSVDRQLSSLKERVEQVRLKVLHDVGQQPTDHQCQHLTAPAPEPTIKINKWVGLGADSSFVPNWMIYGDPYVNVKVKDIIEALCEELDVHITYEPGRTVQDKVVATKRTPAKKTTTKKGKK